MPGWRSSSFQMAAGEAEGFRLAVMWTGQLGKMASPMAAAGKDELRVHGGAGGFEDGANVLLAAPGQGAARVGDGGVTRLGLAVAQQVELHGSAFDLYA
jgi:hypothetical protein